MLLLQSNACHVWRVMAGFRPLGLTIGEQNLTDRKAVVRILERLGWTHISGWVRSHEAIEIKRLILSRAGEVKADKNTILARQEERNTQGNENK